MAHGWRGCGVGAVQSLKKASAPIGRPLRQTELTVRRQAGQRPAQDRAPYPWQANSHIRAVQQDRRRGGVSEGSGSVALHAASWPRGGNAEIGAVRGTPPRCGGKNAARIAKLTKRILTEHPKHCCTAKRAAAFSPLSRSAGEGPGEREVTACSGQGPPPDPIIPLHAISCKPIPPSYTARRRQYQPARMRTYPSQGRLQRIARCSGRHRRKARQRILPPTVRVVRMGVRAISGTMGRQPAPWLVAMSSARPRLPGLVRSQPASTMAGFFIRRRMPASEPIRDRVQADFAILRPCLVRAGRRISRPISHAGVVLSARRSSMDRTSAS